MTQHPSVHKSLETCYVWKLFSEQPFCFSFNFYPCCICKRAGFFEGALKLLFKFGDNSIVFLNVDFKRNCLPKTLKVFKIICPLMLGNLGNSRHLCMLYFKVYGFLCFHYLLSNGYVININSNVNNCTSLLFLDKVESLLLATKTCDEKKNFMFYFLSFFIRFFHEQMEISIKSLEKNLGLILHLTFVPFFFKLFAKSKKFTEITKTNYQMSSWMYHDYILIA